MTIEPASRDMLEKDLLRLLNLIFDPLCSHSTCRFIFAFTRSIHANQRICDIAYEINLQRLNNIFYIYMIKPQVEAETAIGMRNAIN